MAGTRRRGRPANESCKQAMGHAGGARRRRRTSRRPRRRPIARGAARGAAGPARVHGRDLPGERARRAPGRRPGAGRPAAPGADSADGVGPPASSAWLPPPSASQPQAVAYAQPQVVQPQPVQYAVQPAYAPQPIVRGAVGLGRDRVTPQMGQKPRCFQPARAADGPAAVRPAAEGQGDAERRTASARRIARADEVRGPKHCAGRPSASPTNCAGRPCSARCAPPSPSSAPRPGASPVLEIKLLRESSRARRHRRQLRRTVDSPRPTGACRAGGRRSADVAARPRKLALVHVLVQLEERPQVHVVVGVRRTASPPPHERVGVAALLLASP